MIELNKIHNGDCIEILKTLPENSVDAIITDPPYGLEFMGKEWDKFKQGLNIAGGTTGIGTPFGRSKPLNSVYQYDLEQKNQMQDFFQMWAQECLRVLKPGGFLLSFGGTRTYHRMTCGIEDAGFEIRDCIMWLYGSGFPKSLNIGKQIDKLQGNEREVIGDNPNVRKSHKEHIYELGLKQEGLTKGNTEWEGWGTALKPACEPIVVARKPLSEKNVALNVLKWGTGGINIDESRIEYKSEEDKKEAESLGKSFQGKSYDTGRYNFNVDNSFIRNEFNSNPQGRFPANIILDEESAKILDEQSGESISKIGKRQVRDVKETGIVGDFGMKAMPDRLSGHNDKGGASRFFYVAKASKSERNNGLDEFEEKPIQGRDAGQDIRNVPYKIRTTPIKNNHPTVKPIKLMEYLIKLVTRENAVVLDPFLGSGTTAIACAKLNRNFIGVEKEQEYVKIAEARLKPYLEQKKLI